MNKIKFILPSDFKISTIKKIKKLIDKYDQCVEIVFYGSLNPGILNTNSRDNKVLPQVNLEQLKIYNDEIRKNKFVFNYTFNNINFNNVELTEDGRLKILNFIKMLNTKCGINNFTVSNIVIADLIKENFSKINITFSTISGIDNMSLLNKIKEFGIKSVVLNENRIRDFQYLKRAITVKGIDIELILNNHCYLDCIYRGNHYLSMGAYTNINTYTDYYINECSRRFEIEALKIPFIRPEDLDLYLKLGIHSFKVEGRGHIDKSDLFKFLKTYLNRKYNGNLTELLYLFNKKYANLYELNYIDNNKLNKFIDFFKAKKYSCIDHCGINCNYCVRFLYKIKENNNNLKKVYTNKAFLKHGLFTSQEPYLGKNDYIKFEWSDKFD